MEDSTTQRYRHHTNNTSPVGHDGVPPRDKQRTPLGMDSFDEKARQSFGHHLRLFMSLTDGASVPPDTECPQKAMPDEAPAIACRLKQLGQDLSSNLADQLELLVRFDNLEGWKSSGSRHCVAWMDLEMGISPALGWEYLRVGRKLRELAITRALFRAGKLTWSIVRLLSRVANTDNEALLCHSALDATVSDVERLCNDYRWQQEEDSNAAADAENARALQQIEARAFSWNTVSNGNTLIKLTLPPEVAQAFLNSVEQSLAQLEEAAEVPGDKATDDDHSETTLRQRRADAAVLMAENSLQSAGRDMATADRYQVIVSVDAADLKTESAPAPESPSTHPDKRPTIQGAGPVATETVRRLTCDCAVSTIIEQHGEPVTIGRKSRIWPPAMARAIKKRDQHCQYPGCSQTRHLQIHHIEHWADGGTTCVDNGACLCARHHTLVHEGGYRLERVTERGNVSNELFIRQQASDATFSDVERSLRNSRDSFDAVRALSPTRFRFRVVNRYGEDIRDLHRARHSTEHTAEYTAEHGAEHSAQHSAKNSAQNSDEHGAPHCAEHGAEHGAENNSDHKAEFRPSTPIARPVSTPSAACSAPCTAGSTPFTGGSTPSAAYSTRVESSVRNGGFGVAEEKGFYRTREGSLNPLPCAASHTAARRRQGQRPATPVYHAAATCKHSFGADNRS